MSSKVGNIVKLPAHFLTERLHEPPDRRIVVPRFRLKEGCDVNLVDFGGNLELQTRLNLGTA